MINMHLDLETRSEVDLKACGTYRYAKSPTTQLLCACYAVEGDEVIAWDGRDDMPEDLRRLLADDDCLVWAHNAAFERLMFWHNLEREYGAPHVPLERWRCTATLARSFNLPASLEHAAQSIGLRHQKSKRGRELIRLMSVPPYEFSEALNDEMIAYCRQDVIVERAIHSVLGGGTDEMWRDYLVSERINDRGLLVDLEFAEVAAGLASREKEDIKRRFVELTGFNSPQSRTYTKALYEELHTTQIEASSVMERGEKISLDREVVNSLLEDHRDALTAVQTAALELKQEYSGSSASKFQRMIDRADIEDERVRGVYILYGASKSKRYSSVGLQAHNMPRAKLLVAGKPADPDAFINDVLDNKVPLELPQLPALIRPTIMAPAGRTFVCGDWSGIEARALPWMSDAKLRNREVRKLLQRFIDGRDPYIAEAAGIYGIDEEDVTDDERLIGKVAILSLGYGGSVGAFRAMGKNYGLYLSETLMAEIVQGWRNANRWAKSFWELLMRAAMEAVEQYDEEQGFGPVRGAGRVRFQKVGDMLYCTLPDGVQLCYPDIRVEGPPKGKEWAGPQLSCIKASIKPAAGEDEWPRERLWGGLLAENITQAICASLLRDTLARLEARFEDTECAVVLHTHDEIMVEAPESLKDFALKVLTQEMRWVPGWAEGLPLDVKAWTGTYYRK